MANRLFKNLTRMAVAPFRERGIIETLRSIKAKTLYIYNPRDQFYTSQHIAAQVKTVPGARAVAIDSVAGHTIWYNADPQATVAMSKAIKVFLTELAERRGSAERKVGKR